MAGAFLYDDKVAAGTLSAVAGTPSGTLPLANMQDPQPRLRARLLGSTASIVADFGASVPIEAAALISTDLPSNATIRWRVGPSEAFLEAVPAFDADFTAASPSLPAGWTFNRASKGWAFNASGVYTEYAVDTLRYQYDPATLAKLGLLNEPDRTNGIRNPRAEGASAGTPGTNPTNWAATGAILTKSIVASGVTAGIPYGAWRWNGTAGSTGTATMNFETTSGIAATVGQVWTFSLYLQLAAGSLANLTSVQLLMQEVDSGGTTLATQSVAITPLAVALGRSRHAFTVTLAQATCAAVRPALRINFNSGAVVDLTLWAAAQCEQGGDASSLILPAVSSPAATTRAADQVRITGLTIGSAWTLLVKGAAGNPAGNVTLAGLGPTDDANNSSRLIIDSAGTGDFIALAGGVDYGTATVAGTVGQANILVAAASASGTSYARNGTLRTATTPWTVPSGLNRVTLGGLASGDATHVGLSTGCGLYQRLALYATRLLDTQITALSSSGSSLVPAAAVYDSGTAAADTGADANGNVVLLAAAPSTGRCMQVDVTASGASSIDIGRLVAGALWRPSRAMAYGVQEGRMILDRRDRNALTGAEFPVPALVNPRVASFTLPLLTNTEVRGQHRAMLRVLGAAGDALWIPDTGLSRAELNNRSLWGAIATPGEATGAVRETFVGNSRQFRIMERV